MTQNAAARRLQRLRAAAVAVLMALQPLAAPIAVLTAPVPAVPLVTAATAAAVITLTPDEASARAGSSSRSSSGGYSRPSSSRTPSVGGSSGGYSRPSTSRTPSTGGSGGGWFSGGSSSSSGGYARPGAAAPSVAAPPTSAGDRAISQQGSADALNRYRTRQDADRNPPPTAQQPTQPSGTGSSGSGWSWGGGSSGYGRTPSTRPAPVNPYGGYGWSPPPYAYTAPRRFGLWDGLFLWFMLDTLTRPGHASFFHDNANDPGYREWRQEADRQAKDNAELRAKLDQLDQSMAAQADAPREQGRLPPDVPADLARADSGSSAGATDAARADAAKAGRGSGMGGFWWWGILLLGAAVLFLLWRARRRMDNPPAKTAAPVSKGGSDVPLFGTLGNYVNQKLGGQRYSPSLFRVGMTVTIDPAPFLLAEGVTKVKAPDTGTDRLVSIEAVGTVTSGPATVYRLHLPGSGFFQIHLGADGQPDECRYFTPLDSVTPADEGEWGFWLDDAEGMIGWPEFQTKDGKVYPRVWQPGTSRIQPFTLSEARQTLRGTETVVSQAMLYGAPTGAAAPAPEREYILVEAVERGGLASVEVSAGIDVNPASLSLA
ncbi:DUF2491 family protein [Azospirillum sp. TSO35-2]|uniref:DUF2491 family protein n=1 Tax=Azospirillum sp. TSO35-2 TaxID=716796 RepID=UPI000D6054A5|nr:DUF2491 family protein [Azospirillum sp. TSO35-2]PWC38983.1 hypothetical protein TSO352_01665 [Azospirillum sp. TSO35-2]